MNLPFRFSLSSLLPGSVGLAAVIACAVSAVPVLAGPVTELEANGTAVNNTITTAQAVLFTSFTPNVNPNVFGSLPTATITGANGGDDVDFFSFQTGVGTGYFDIDNSPFTFDSILSLFDSAGTLLAVDDDSFPEDPGTENGFDAFLGTYTFTQAGTYYVTVSQFANFPITAGAFGAQLTRPDGQFGGNLIDGAAPGDSSFGANGAQFGSGYTLNISLSNPSGVAPVPEPSEWLAMGMATASVGGLMLRARRRKSGKSSTTPAA